MLVHVSAISCRNRFFAQDPRGETVGVRGLSPDPYRPQRRSSEAQQGSAASGTQRPVGATAPVAP